MKNAKIFAVVDRILVDSKRSLLAGVTKALNKLQESGSYFFLRPGSHAECAQRAARLHSPAEMFENDNGFSKASGLIADFLADAMWPTKVI